MAGQQDDGQPSHIMPIGVLPNQLTDLWEELCAAYREIGRLRQEQDVLLAERSRLMDLACPASARQPRGGSASPEAKERDIGDYHANTEAAP
jgi:hypothetical protein